MKEGRKLEYPQKTPGDEVLSKLAHLRNHQQWPGVLPGWSSPRPYHPHPLPTPPHSSPSQLCVLSFPTPTPHPPSFVSYHSSPSPPPLLTLPALCPIILPPPHPHSSPSQLCVLSFLPLSPHTLAWLKHVYLLNDHDYSQVLCRLTLHSPLPPPPPPLSSPYPHPSAPTLTCDCSQVMLRADPPPAPLLFLLSALPFPLLPTPLPPPTHLLSLSFNCLVSSTSSSWSLVFCWADPAVTDLCLGVFWQRCLRSWWPKFLCVLTVLSGVIVTYVSVCSDNTEVMVTCVSVFWQWSHGDLCVNVFWQHWGHGALCVSVFWQHWGYGDICVSVFWQHWGHGDLCVSVFWQHWGHSDFSVNLFQQQYLLVFWWIFNRWPWWKWPDPNLSHVNYSTCGLVSVSKPGLLLILLQ